MKAHIGVDEESGLVHRGDRHDGQCRRFHTGRLAVARTRERSLCCAGNTGVEKRPGHDGRQVRCRVAARRSARSRRPQPRGNANAERPLRMIKRQFGYTKRPTRIGEKPRSVGDTVCAVEFVDGPPIFIDECRRGASLMLGAAAAIYSQRLKHRHEQLM